MEYYVAVESGVHIYVEDLNPSVSKTILFLHGWLGDHTLFEYQFAELPKLGFRCIGPDMRGFGRSDQPWHGYNCDRLAADDVRAVIDTLGLSEISQGGIHRRSCCRAV